MRKEQRGKLRLFIMIMIFGVVTTSVCILGFWKFAPALGWMSASIIYNIWVWKVISPMNAQKTQIHAQAEDSSKTTREFLILSANVLALFSVGLVLFGSHASNSSKIWIALLGLATVIPSWLLVHTLFTLRYASIYYTHNPPSGISFNQEEPPKYLDFAYMAFSVGMTYQVSDTNITNSRMRKCVLQHSIFAFIFGTGIIATTINLVVSLL